MNVIFNTKRTHRFFKIYLCVIIPWISINNSDFDSNDRFKGPLVSIGAEYGNDLKFYTEYLSTVENFDNGRFSAGLRVLFK